MKKPPMKITPVFSIVIAIHLMVTAGLFIFPGCQSGPDAESTKLQKPMATTVQPTPAAATESIKTKPVVLPSSYGRRYPPTRPNWNLSSPDKAEVISGYNALPDGQKPLSPEPAESVTVTEEETVEGIAVLEEGSAPAKTYVVKKGDNLSTIARKQGVSFSELMTLNGLSQNSVLKIGQVLKIPNSALTPQSVEIVQSKSLVVTERLSGEGTYKVQAGDTLSEIAQKNGVSVSDIRNANSIVNDRIFIGQVLVIPGSSGASTASSSPVTKAKPAAPAPSSASSSSLKGENTYTVKSGDTLGGIASRAGVPIKDLAQLNQIKDPRKLKVGQVLTLPSGANVASSKSSSAPAAATSLAAKPAVSQPLGAVTATATTPSTSATGTAAAPAAASTEPANVPTVEVVDESAEFYDLEAIPVVPVQSQ